MWGSRGILSEALRTQAAVISRPMAVPGPARSGSRPLDEHAAGLGCAYGISPIIREDTDSCQHRTDRTNVVRGVDLCEGLRREHAYLLGRAAGNTQPPGYRRDLAAEHCADECRVPVREGRGEIDRLDRLGAIPVRLIFRFPEEFRRPVLTDHEGDSRHVRRCGK